MKAHDEAQEIVVQFGRDTVDAGIYDRIVALADASNRTVSGVLECLLASGEASCGFQFSAKGLPRTGRHTWPKDES